MSSSLTSGEAESGIASAASQKAAYLAALGEEHEGVKRRLARADKASPLAARLADRLKAIETEQKKTKKGMPELERATVENEDTEQADASAAG